MSTSPELLGQLPVIYNVANLPKPAPGEPALISFTDVTTMFHEFGHALHGMFANTQYPSLSGTSVSRDFVEFPSQFNEHWASYPAVFNHYAKHISTGAPMPAELAAKIKKAATFNQGYELTELLAASQLDMQWHTLPSDAPLQNPDDFGTQALQKTHLDLSDVPPRYRSSYFAHIWGGGYAAGYYAYNGRRCSTTLPSSGSKITVGSPAPMAIASAPWFSPAATPRISPKCTPPGSAKSPPSNRC